MLNWEDAQAWQTAYGFSSFILELQGYHWKIDRIGEQYFRVNINDNMNNMTEEAIYVLEEILSVIDPRRKLLIQSRHPISAVGVKHLGTKLRMWRKGEG